MGFPLTPSINQVHTEGTIAYTWTGQAWTQNAPVAAHGQKADSTADSHSSLSDKTTPANRLVAADAAEIELYGTTRLKTVGTQLLIPPASATFGAGSVYEFAGDGVAGAGIAFDSGGAGGTGRVVFGAGDGTFRGFFDSVGMRVNGDVLVPTSPDFSTPRVRPATLGSHIGIGWSGTGQFAIMDANNWQILQQTASTRTYFRQRLQIASHANSIVFDSGGSSILTQADGTIGLQAGPGEIQFRWNAYRATNAFFVANAFATGGNMQYVRDDASVGGLVGGFIAPNGSTRNIKQNVRPIDNVADLTLVAAIKQMQPVLYDNSPDFWRRVANEVPAVPTGEVDEDGNEVLGEPTIEYSYAFERALKRIDDVNGVEHLTTNVGPYAWSEDTPSTIFVWDGSQYIPEPATFTTDRHNPNDDWTDDWYVYDVSQIPQEDRLAANKGETYDKIGFIAEDVAALDPRLVMQEPDGTVGGLNEHAISVGQQVLIHEQIKTITDQQKQISNLVAHNAALNTFVDTMVSKTNILLVAAGEEPLEEFTFNPGPEPVAPAELGYLIEVKDDGDGPYTEVTIGTEDLAGVGGPPYVTFNPTRGWVDFWNIPQDLEWIARVDGEQAARGAPDAGSTFMYTGVDVVAESVVSVVPPEGYGPPFTIPVPGDV